MNAAKLPDEFLQPPPRCLADLQVVDEGAVEFTSMLIDAENRCYLDPKAKLHEGEDRVPFLEISVRRMEQGFEVSIPSNAGFRYTPGEYILGEGIYRRWVPVAKLTVIEEKPSK